MKNIIKKIALIIVFFFLSYLYYNSFVRADISLIMRTRGRVLLQVEKNGEAWYVDPFSDKRFYLGRPADALEIMKGLGVGITNTDLLKIPLGKTNLSGVDSDKDGLSDSLEDALNTNKNNNNTDGDNYKDSDEIFNNYNPNGIGKLPIDIKFSENQAGKILLQIEKNGEAWYINPGDKKRYFLGGPSDAFNVMKKLGLGINNNNLSQIPEHYIDNTKKNNYIVENNTVIATDNPNNRQYSDAIYPFSFEYPINFKIQKSNDFNYITFLGDYDKSVFKEEKAFITIFYEKTDEETDIDNFKTAGKTNAKKIYGKNITLNNKMAYTEEYRYSENNSYEITTTIQNKPKEFLQILLVSSLNSKNNYNKIYNNLINSVVLK